MKPSTPQMKQAKTNVERKKETIKQNNRARNWDVGIPQLNHPDYINIYIYVRRGRKTERRPLESKTEVETVEQEDETMRIKRWGMGRN